MGFREINLVAVFTAQPLKSHISTEKSCQPQRNGREGHSGRSRVNLSLPVTQSEARMALKLSE